MTFSSPESSGDEDELRALPSGVVRKRKGWAGEEMEAARSLHHNVDEDDVKTGALRESFQNKEVGEGYQHRTVRRQNTGLATGPGKIVDMTGGGGGEESEKSKRKRSYDDESEEEEGITVKEMLKNREMRAFKKEIAKIIQQA